MAKDKDEMPDWAKEFGPKLDKIAEELKNHREMSQPYFTGLKIASGVATLLAATCVAGVIYVNSSLARLDTTSTAHKDTLARLEATSAKHADTIGELKGTVALLARENKRLANLLEDPRHFAHMPFTTIKGHITKVDGDQLVVRRDGKESTYKLSKDTLIFGKDGGKTSLEVLSKLKGIPIWVHLSQDNKKQVSIIEVDPMDEAPPIFKKN